MAVNQNADGFLHNKLEHIRLIKLWCRQVCISSRIIYFDILDQNATGPGPTHSIFPADVYELENTKWEDDIILDSENMTTIPSNFYYYIL